MFRLKKRRKNRRYLVTEQLSIRFDNNEFLEGTGCHDISLGGMCIIIDDKIETESKYGTVMLVIKYNDELIFFESRFVKIWDRLVFVDKNDTRMGIKFIDTDNKNISALKRIITLQSEPKDKKSTV